MEVDLALTLRVQVDGGGSTHAGSRGHLEFQIARVDGSHGWQPGFTLAHVDPIPLEPERTLVLHTDQSNCPIEEWRVMPGDHPELEPGYYYQLFSGALPQDEALICRVGFQVPDEAETQTITWFVWPYPCHHDGAYANNWVSFRVGGRAPRPVPTMTWGEGGGGGVTALLVLAALFWSVALLRRW